MLDPEVVLRFVIERQTLAALHHPNIVRLLDGGATEQGFPYLVVEFVKGTAIDLYCDTAKLSPADRLRLFIEVSLATVLKP